MKLKANYEQDEAIKLLHEALASGWSKVVAKNNFDGSWSTYGSPPHRNHVIIVTKELIGKFNNDKKN